MANMNDALKEHVSESNPNIECVLFSEDSCVTLHNSWLINTHVKNSILHLTNGTAANIIGDRNVFHCTDFKELLHHGNDNTIIIQNSKDLVWSGSQGQCSLENCRDISIYGNENQILGNVNFKLLVCGHQNSIVANQNENLKVRGHANYVSATRTNNVSIERDGNFVSVSDIDIRHSLTKAASGLVTGFSFEIIPENHMDFCGIPTGSSVYADILCPQMNIFESIVSPIKSYSPSCICDKFYENWNTENEAFALVPQVRICYADKAIIKKNSYHLGIFKVNVEGLSNIHHPHSPIKVEVISDDLDDGSFRFNLTNCKMLTCFGSKQGVCQSLRITGNHISENVDASFYVYFEILEETLREGPTNGKSEETEEIFL